MNFTGIDSPYEAPLSPEITLSTMEMDAETPPLPLSIGQNTATSDLPTV